jgi:hypothetical protein
MVWEDEDRDHRITNYCANLFAVNRRRRLGTTFDYGTLAYEGSNLNMDLLRFTQIIAARLAHSLYWEWQSEMHWRLSQYHRIITDGRSVLYRLLGRWLNMDLVWELQADTLITAARLRKLIPQTQSNKIKK